MESDYEQSIPAEVRRANGVHYTPPGLINPIIHATITRFYEPRILETESESELGKILDELACLRVLDPACGIGNFLIAALKELIRLELLINEKTGKYSRLNFSDNLFGIDIDAKALTIADEILVKESRGFPTLINEDALFIDWPEADIIIGNPPFLGGSRIKTELGDNYKAKLKKKYPSVNGKADFCCYWFRLAHDKIGDNGRVGMVGTNSISQNNGRKASLEYIIKNEGQIYEAISSMKWPGKAAVHVSVVNWAKKPYKPVLDGAQVVSINSSLTTGIDISGAKGIKANLGVGFNGMNTNGRGFEIKPEQALSWIETDPKNKEVLKPFLGGDTLSKSPNGKPGNWVIDFNNMSFEKASEYELPFNWVLENVKPGRQLKKDHKLRDKWWLFVGSYTGLREALSGLSLYFGCPRVSKWSIFVSLSIGLLPDDQISTIASEDFYVLGILTSSIHRKWMKAQASSLGGKNNIRYTLKSCFRTFPFPQEVTPEQIDAIRQTMILLHEYRSEIMEKKQWGITTLYNNFFDNPNSELRKWHDRLDKLVMDAYGLTDGDDILTKLLTLNLELSAKEAAGERVIGAKDYRYAPDIYC